MDSMGISSCPWETLRHRVREKTPEVDEENRGFGGETLPGPNGFHAWGYWYPKMDGLQGVPPFMETTNSRKACFSRR